MVERAGKVCISELCFSSVNFVWSRFFFFVCYFCREGFSIIEVYNGVLDFYEKDKYYQEGSDLFPSIQWLIL
jgi:hypothetical protein